MNRHKAAVCEDDPDALDRICDIVASLDHEPIPLTTLDEIKDFLASGEDPCYWLQDMQMPHKKGARPHEKVGETGIRLATARSFGRFGWPIIVITGFRNDPKFVMSAARLGADEFIEKDHMNTLLADAIQQWLEKKGRAEHSACAACNARSRPSTAPPPASEAVVVARLYSHEHKVGPLLLGQPELEAVVERRRELHLFLNAAQEEPEGFRAGRADLDGRYKELFLQRSYAEAIAELATARQAVRPYTMACLRRAGLGGSPSAGARLMERARKLVDVNQLVNGRPSRRKWRSIHTVDDKDLRAFWFDPPAGVRWAILLPPGG